MKSEELLKEVLGDEELSQLKTIGFFSCPASSKHHLSKEGGLQEHSSNVTETMLKINESMNLGLSRKDIILAGMLHDLAKVSYYELNILKSGKQSEAEPYKWKPKILLPHGPDSIYLAINDLKIELSVPVATAISWHMGFDFERDKGIINNLCKQPIDIMLTWLLQTADRYATWVLEVDLSE